MKRLLVFFVTGMIVFLNGCLPSKEIESLGIINTRGVDLTDDEKVKTTLVYFQFDSESTDITRIVSGVGETIKGARANANFKTNFELTAGQIRLEIYGLETAKKGILPYIDTLIRDAKVADTMLLAVSKNKAEEMITMGQEDTERSVGHYLYRLIEQSINDDIIPRTNLQDFIHAYYDAGKDPVLPMITIAERQPKLYAMALFQGDKYVGQVTNEQAFLINMLEKTVQTTLLELKLPLKPFQKYLVKKSEKDNVDQDETFSILLGVLKGHGRTKAINNSNLTFKTTVNLELRLQELSKEIKLQNPKVIDLLEKEIEKNLKEQYSELLKKTQELNADPFGYGNVYRLNKKSGELKVKEWRDKFPKIDVTFDINAKIMRHGTIQ